MQFLNTVYKLFDLNCFISFQTEIISVHFSFQDPGTTENGSSFKAIENFILPKVSNKSIIYQNIQVNCLSPGISLSCLYRSCICLYAFYMLLFTMQLSHNFLMMNDSLLTQYNSLVMKESIHRLHGEKRLSTFL